MRRSKQLSSIVISCIPIAVGYRIGDANYLPVVSLHHICLLATCTNAVTLRMDEL
jgi:hypothetical protein